MTQKSLESLARPNRRLWYAAIKPPMYSVAVMPILVSTAVVRATQQPVHLWVFATFLLSAILILAWENLSNDVFDADTGVDVNKAESLVNITGNQSLIFWIGNACLAAGLLGIGAIAHWQQDWTVIGLILLCCGIGYIYQGPPFRLGYRGLGEILCFFPFGPIGFSAVYYSQTQTFAGMNLAASVIIGLTTSLILFCSHFHQLADDLAVGKRSPIVRLGTARAAQLVPWLSGSVYGLTLLWVGLGVFPWPTLLLGLSVPLAWKLCQHVRQHHNHPELVRNAKYVAVKLHFWSGILLAIGFAIAPIGI